MSIVIPARNCGPLLSDCLEAINHQTYSGPVDVTVALAPSTGSDDNTEAVLDSVSLRWPLQIVANPAGSTPAGLNAAIDACEGSVIARVDAGARIPAHYLERAVATMASTGAANVGGVQHPVASGGTQRVIAAALTSTFGAGTARFRHGSHEGPADTVYLGVFDRDALEDVGGFDESFERNQDYELNWRLRDAGHTVWLDPLLTVSYVPRSDLASLGRQYFEYGIWKRRMLLRHPRSLKPRQLAAPVLVAGLLSSFAGLLRGRCRALLLPVTYVGCAAIAAARLRTKLPESGDRLVAMQAFAVMHLAWGTGFLFGHRRLRCFRCPWWRRHKH